MAVAEAAAGRSHPRGRWRGTSPWAIALTAGLLAAGFHRGRAAESGREARRRADEARRGRHADSPGEIHAPGWKDILARVWSAIGEDRVIAIAAGVTFFVLLAIFPAIAALVALYGLFADPQTITAHIESLGDVLPGGAIDVLRDQIERVSSQVGRTLGLTFAAGLAASLWSANAGMKALFDALNVVYGEEETRSFVRLTLQSLLSTVAAILFLLVALGAIVVIPILLSHLGLAGYAGTLVRLGRWPALFVIVTLGLALLYRYGPDRERAKWRWISWGSALAALLWLAASMLFSWYTANFGSYNETYGSLGAVIGFMTWIWISAIVVLLGAELDAEMERQTARDTTTGPPRPMGERGAWVADTVGEARR